MIPRRRLQAVCLASLLFLASASGAFAAAPRGSAPASNGGRVLAARVVAGKGVLPVAIRTTVADQDNILSVDWPKAASGIHRTTLYSLGVRDLKPDDFVRLLRYKPEMVVLTAYDMEDTIPHATVGAVFPMTSGTQGLTLVVTNVTPGYFTLVDQSGGQAGSVTYGAFKDNTGELWLFEECVGDFFNSPEFFGMHNEHMIESTHKVIEAALTLYKADLEDDPDDRSSDSGGPCPAKYLSSHVVGVNHHVDTGVAVHRGDVVTIKASGSVTLGIFAGSSGPEGISFMPGYSYFPDSPHGCLIGRVRTSGEDDDDKWAYIGAGDTWNIKADGLIQLNLNDNDPENNVGEYRVEISVCREH